MRLSTSVYFTVYSLQFIIPEVECEEFGPGAQAERWRPLQAVVAQVQVLQFTQGLRDSNEDIRHREKQNKGCHKQEKKENMFFEGVFNYNETNRNL